MNILLFFNQKKKVVARYSSYTALNAALNSFVTLFLNILYMHTLWLHITRCTKQIAVKKLCIIVILSIWSNIKLFGLFEIVLKLGFVITAKSLRKVLRQFNDDGPIHHLRLLMSDLQARRIARIFGLFDVGCCQGGHIPLLPLWYSYNSTLLRSNPSVNDALLFDTLVDV